MLKSKSLILLTILLVGLAGCRKPITSHSGSTGNPGDTGGDGGTKTQQTGGVSGTSGTSDLPALKFEKLGGALALGKNANEVSLDEATQAQFKFSAQGDTGFQILNKTVHSSCQTDLTMQLIGGTNAQTVDVGTKVRLQAKTDYVLNIAVSAPCARRSLDLVVWKGSYDQEPRLATVCSAYPSLTVIPQQTGLIGYATVPFAGEKKFLAKDVFCGLAATDADTVCESKKASGNIRGTIAGITEASCTSKAHSWKLTFDNNFGTVAVNCSTGFTTTFDGTYNSCSLSLIDGQKYK